MARAVLDEAMVLASLALFLGTVTVWAHIMAVL
jgi:hypothetical protein